GTSTGSIAHPYYQTKNTLPITVTPAKLAWNTKSQSLAVGQYQQGCCGSPVLTNVSAPGAQAAPLTVTITHSHPSYVTTPASVTIATGSSSALVSTVGAALGRDTIIASAPDIAPDTMIVDVGVGKFEVYAGDSWPSSIRVGETSPIGASLLLLTPNGGREQVKAAVAFSVTLTPGATFIFVDGAGNEITSVTVPAGSTQSSHFYMKGIAPGTSTGMVSHPNYQTTNTLPVVVN
ncbi:MAG TPA: hypothetical protein VMM17_09155, partial [Gemmatimonadaceae bacterium]|nr:hypothetical protein [Gemmatimonadaceae bacterium]